MQYDRLSQQQLSFLLFILYTAYVTAIAALHSVRVGLHTYADDTQVYTFYSVGAKMAAQLLRCIDDVSQWMSSNRPKQRRQDAVHLARSVYLDNFNKSAASSWSSTVFLSHLPTLRSETSA